MKATVQVIDLQVFALPRITLKPLVPSFPCFANIFVSLMEKPHVDFGLKLVGIDLMSIPIVDRVVQEIIKDQVANMYLWPKSLTVEILKTFQESRTLQRAPDNTPDGGGMLVVIVHEAEYVEGKHHTNPYVCILFRGEKRKTKALKKNRDPKWEEEFTFMLDDPPEMIKFISKFAAVHQGWAYGSQMGRGIYFYVDSKNGRIQIVLQWRTKE
ncbi:synaptotagmin 2 [Hibiscus trionum]|uniref:Synaptotagmin 2 n=1 Tax=Hibiscus trionum TaxID=183268 RepID=A0A9W7JAA6_HIBTR|nr:synaptotagmin 2 [Hibiscus trionum]